MSAKVNPKAEVIAEDRIDLGLISTILVLDAAAAGWGMKASEDDMAACSGRRCVSDFDSGFVSLSVAAEEREEVVCSSLGVDRLTEDITCCGLPRKEEGRGRCWKASVVHTNISNTKHNIFDSHVAFILIDDPNSDVINE